jgi:hypothetical protein
VVTGTHKRGLKINCHVLMTNCNVANGIRTRALRARDDVAREFGPSKEITLSFISVTV